MDIEQYTHNYCFFYKDGNLVTGWVEGIQKNKLLIAPQQGKTILLAPNRIPIFWKHGGHDVQKKVCLEKLTPQLEQIQTFAENQDLATIHELCEPGESYTLDDLVNDFLDEPDNALERVGLFYALENDRYYFKRKNNTYTPRTSEELEQLDAQEKREQAKREWEVKVNQWVAAIDSGDWNATTIIDDEQQQWIQQVRSVLIYGKDSGYWKTIAPLFNLSATPNEDDDQKLRNLLLQVGQPLSWGKLLLLRSSVQFEFSQTLLDLAQQLSESPLQTEDRKDWLHLSTFTIDSEKTEDYDDAFSIIGWADNRIEVAVHIADLSDVIPPNSALFEESEKRISSVYTLKEIFPMLPSSLSNDFFSLKSEEKRNVMSFVFHLFRNGESVLQQIEFGVINVENNLTYDQVDQWIKEEDSFWGILSKCCQAHRQKRVEHGALDFDRKEVQLDISDPQNIQIYPVNRASLANQMVEELAVLVNEAVGQYFHSHDCPGIYRTQPPYEIVKEVTEGEKLSMDHISIEPARLSTVPEGHAGLGCDYYMQATSPIRRFVDLVTQYQLAQHLRYKNPVFVEEQLMSWAERIQETQKTYAAAERELLNHWKAKYLMQHQGEVFVAIIRRHLRGGRSVVLFDDIQYISQVSGLAQYDENAMVSLRIENVDVDHHFVSATLYQEEEARNENDISMKSNTGT